MSFQVCAGGGEREEIALWFSGKMALIPIYRMTGKDTNVKLMWNQLN